MKSRSPNAADLLHVLSMQGTGSDGLRTNLTGPGGEVPVLGIFTLIIGHQIRAFSHHNKKGQTFLSKISRVAIW